MIKKTINGKEITFEAALDFGGNVSLKATHIDGVEVAGGFIATIYDDGKLYREPSISGEFGLNLNKSGQIKIIKGE